MIEMLTKEENPLPDFEEALRVIKIDDTHYVGAHPLRLPVSAGRGVYGGHMIAQSLLVGIESSRISETGEYMVPDSFHLYFINAGNWKCPMEYTITNLYDDGLISKKYIIASQRGKNRTTCLVTLRKAGTKTLHSHSHSHSFDESIPPPALQAKYPNPDELHQIQHTDFVRNAVGDEFFDHKLCPEENKMAFSDRWVTVFSGLTNIPEPGSSREKIIDIYPDALGELHEVEKDILRPKDSQSIKNPIFNFIGLADISDSAFITTIARVLHLPWTPSLERDETYDATSDATYIARSTLNAIHIFHYNAMSLDHHIYFHNDEYEPTDGSAFDVCKDWLAFTYQMKRLSNNRLVARGFIFNENKKCIATVVQEGLTIMFDGIGSTANKAHL
ncbi:hypothetical protein KGF56_001332 [Candida oxycetoniae]|uniref:Acyl-CoA thioesterase-like C-terminal domain-containing protein n=1 Tax=Candida oxycetoniae TaxID=497107 RepID=A0AAI9WYU8_9ASCO|nr:uncharacterized protein KGF56_001332 [Candida oxycetoniae]KAI3405726.2 hypothetical protein KGF56_001332 [Candida oxycetoniae]